jgi:hypothetical protein
LPLSEVEEILKAHGGRKPSEARLAAQLSEGSPGQAMELDAEMAVSKRKVALQTLERAARGQGFRELFADTNALAKDRDFPFEELIAIFYGLLSDLLELTSGAKTTLLRNPHLAKELEALARAVNTPWVMRAIAGIDEVAAGARRNLNRQLGLDALAASLSSSEPPVLRK